MLSLLSSKGSMLESSPEPLAEVGQRSDREAHAPPRSLARSFGPPPRVAGEGLATAARVLLATLEALGYRARALRSYRLGPVHTPQPVPLLLDMATEAALVPPDEAQLGVCLQGTAGTWHDLVYWPQSGRLLVDRRKTVGLDDDASHGAFVAALHRAFPECEIAVRQPSWLRADFRAAETLAALAPLPAMFDGPLAEQRLRLAHLNTVAALTEKTSRVSSWTVRTAYAPFVAAAAVLLYLLFGVLPLSAGLRDLFRYLLTGLFGGAMMVLGMAAVRLTAKATLLSLRAAEYQQLLDAREGKGAMTSEPDWEAEASAFAAASPLERVDDVARLKRAWLAVALERDVGLRAIAEIAERPGVEPLQDGWRGVRDHA